MESSDYRLADLLDMSIIQNLGDSNFRATGLPMSIIDEYDTSILVRAGWTDICMNFHRANPASNRRCVESDASVRKHLVDGKAHQYKCKNGLWHVAIPIMVAGRRLATMFLSQFYFEGEVPEREFFIRQAREFDYDLDGYLKALDRLPVFSLEKVNYILAFNQALAKFISDLAIRSLEVKKAHAGLEDRVKERTAELAQALATSGEINRQLTHEIIERRRAEEALQESEKRLANIIDFLPDATFAIDAKGKVIAWNKAIEEMTGVKAKDMLGKDNYEYALPFYGERRPTLIDLVLEPDGIEKYEEVKREDRALMAVGHLYNFRGKETYLFGKASALIDSHGDIIGSIESIRNITALREAEAERLRLSKIESLGILAGGIAHDFNNIFTIILGNIGLAMLDGKIEPQVRDRLAQAEQACLRAQALSRQLLTFAKGGAPIKRIVSIVNLVKESAILTLSGSKSRCEMEIPGDLWPVEADEGQINQVISNLLINADQAMPEGGIIKIKAENCLVEAESNLPISKGKYVKLVIADQGIGISPKYLEKIFDPYFSTKQKGSGLGLATAYSIIKNHSGHIQVESQLGVGATFHIYLPATDKGVPAAERETAKPIMGQGKVLVMDDEEMVRDVLGGMLNMLGYEADFASDGSQAIEQFVQAQEANQGFDAVILDLTIPGGMGGKEAIKELLKIDPQVKAIVSSGYSDDPIMADFQKYGFAGVIAKPYKVAELGKVLNNALTGNE